MNRDLPLRVIAVSWKRLLLFYPDNRSAAIAAPRLSTDPLDSLCCGDDRDALEAGDDEQIDIAGDDEIVMRCERGGDDLIVIGIGIRNDPHPRFSLVPEPVRAARPEPP